MVLYAWVSSPPRCRVGGDGNSVPDLCGCWLARKEKAEPKEGNRQLWDTDTQPGRCKLASQEQHMRPTPPHMCPYSVLQPWPAPGRSATLQFREQMKSCFHLLNCTTGGRIHLTRHLAREMREREKGQNTRSTKTCGRAETMQLYPIDNINGQLKCAALHRLPQKPLAVESSQPHQAAGAESRGPGTLLKQPASRLGANRHVFFFWEPTKTAATKKRDRQTTTRECERANSEKKKEKKREQHSTSETLSRTINTFLSLPGRRKRMRLKKDRARKLNRDRANV